MVMRSSSFFENCLVAGARWWLHLATKSVILSQEIQLIEILSIFLFFFAYTCDFCRALATQQFKKNRITIASKKIARVAAALSTEHNHPLFEQLGPEIHLTWIKRF